MHSSSVYLTWCPHKFWVSQFASAVVCHYFGNCSCNLNLAFENYATQDQKSKSLMLRFKIGIMAKRWLNTIQGQNRTGWIFVEISTISELLKIEFTLIAEIVITIITCSSGRKVVQAIRGFIAFIIYVDGGIMCILKIWFYKSVFLWKTMTTATLVTKVN